MSRLLTRRRIAPAGQLITPPTDPLHVMPTGNLPGYRLVWSDNFDYDLPIGSVTPNQQGRLTTGAAAPVIGNKLGFYADNWRTTHDGKVYPILSTEPGYIPPGGAGYPAKHPAVVSKYWPSKTVEFKNGSIRVKQHSELIGGVNTALGAVWKPILASGAYLAGPFGRYRFRSRHVEVVSGETGVDLAAAGDFTSGKANNWHYVPLAIDSATWVQRGGEFDYPEHETNRKIAGNHHPGHADGADDVTQHFEPSPAASPYEWHVHDVEWTPTMVRYRLDGVVVFTSTSNVPDWAMAILSQHEANWRQPTGSSVTETDWWVIWEYDPSITA